MVLTFSKGGFRTRAQQFDVDFDQTENTVRVELEPLAAEVESGS